MNILSRKKIILGGDILLEIRGRNRYYRGENETKHLLVISSYSQTPISIEFRFPDDNIFNTPDLIPDESGVIDYILPREVLFQTGRVSVQATAHFDDGKIEKSGVYNISVGESINAADNMSVILYNKRLYSKGINIIRVVGDNSDYYLTFEGVDNLGNSFAIFNRDSKTSSPIAISADGKVNIPTWLLKEGSFDVGIYAEGFASTPLKVYVEGSIVDKNSAIYDEPDKTIVEQLLHKVNNIRYIKSCEIIDGKLIIKMNDDSVVDAGFVVDNETSVNKIQSNYEQNDETEPDYIKNRTHWKEEKDGKIIYHKLDSKYLNIDTELTENSSNPVTNKTVTEAFLSSKPEAISALEIEEIIKNIF